MVPLLLAGALALAACSGSSPGPGGGRGPGSTLAPVGASPARQGQVRFGATSGGGLSGTLTVLVGADSFTVVVTAAGLVPGKRYALHLHRGRCPGRGTIQSTYQLPDLVADANGRGEISTRVRDGLPPDPETIFHFHGGASPGTDDYRRTACVPLPG